MVQAGRGGDGCVSFRHEKYVPRGGPDGGDGGRGGDVILLCADEPSTLSEFRHRRHLRGESGRPGQGNNRFGKSGESITALVPPGTIVSDAETGEMLGDLTERGQVLVVARGGRGGKGNARFKTAVNRAPRRMQPGEDGEQRTLRLELRLLADAGLVGLPNAGKSTLLSRVSAARPRVADYPFTTLEPQLGVVEAGGSNFVLADLPGLIEGAHRGEGLGHEFLRHIERTRVIIHVLDLAPPDGSDPLENFDLICRELELYGDLAQLRPQIVAANKVDLPDAACALDKVRESLQARGFTVYGISAATGRGVGELMNTALSLVENSKRKEASGRKTEDKVE